jgi:hypothetical protein
MEWTRSVRPAIADPLRQPLIAHVQTTGTDPMKFRMAHDYGADHSG